VPSRPSDLLGPRDQVAVGTSLLMGFPLGFHDTLHHLPVVRTMRAFFSATGMIAR